MTASFTGSYTVKMGNVAVNGALEYTISIIVSDGPDFATASSSAGA
jgi:hypothetical protein